MTQDNMENQDKHRPVKLTVTFANGRTEDFDVFMVAVASGLLPSAKIDDMVAYVAPKEGFKCYSLSAIAADAPVIVGLLNAINFMVKDIIHSMDLGMTLQMLRALNCLNSKDTDLYRDIKIVHKDIKEN